MPPAIDWDYVRKFVPAHPDSFHPMTLVLLHVTGRDENSLLSPGIQLWPEAALLGLRGVWKVACLPRSDGSQSQVWLMSGPERKNSRNSSAPSANDMGSVREWSSAIPTVQTAQQA
jgi:predicted esterase